MHLSKVTKYGSAVLLSLGIFASVQTISPESASAKLIRTTDHAVVTKHATWVYNKPTASKKHFTGKKIRKNAYRKVLATDLNKQKQKWYKVARNQWIRASDAKSVELNDHKGIVSEYTSVQDNNQIVLPKGYTTSRIKKASQGRLHGKNLLKLKSVSMSGMLSNQFTDSKSDQNRQVDLLHLNENQKKEFSLYALNLINQARRQMGKKDWKISKGAIHFADRVGYQYWLHNHSCWDPDHYTAGINLAAKQSGLKAVGQVYEDEGGLIMNPVTDVNTVKKGIYFNVKQMLFGGFSGQDYHDLNNYNEWEHAGDLLSLRSNNSKQENKMKYFGLSFSNLKGNQKKVSTHFMSVDPKLISNKYVFRQ